MGSWNTSAVSSRRLTFGDALGIFHVHGRLDGQPARETGAGNESGRHGHDDAIPLQLPAPPVRAEELHELGFGVDGEAVLA